MTCFHCLALGIALNNLEPGRPHRLRRRLKQLPLRGRHARKPCHHHNVQIAAQRMPDELLELAPIHAFRHLAESAEHVEHRNVVLQGPLDRQHLVVACDLVINPQCFVFPSLRHEKNRQRRANADGKRHDQRQPPLIQPTETHVSHA